jgi:hypothetical protein
MLKWSPLQGKGFAKLLEGRHRRISEAKEKPFAIEAPSSRPMPPMVSDRRFA